MIGMQQVHGNSIVRVYRKDDGKTIENCDALITNEKNLELCVRVADCLPISVIDKKGRGIGLIHAGWRGLSKGIIVKTIEKMHNSLKIENCKLLIYIGPHICVKHYEIKNNVASKFSKYPKALKTKDRKIYLDLAGIAKSQLIEVGIKDENIAIDPVCTFENHDLFSYRRDGTNKRNLHLLKL